MTENKRIRKFRVWDIHRERMIYGPTAENHNSAWVFNMYQSCQGVMDYEQFLHLMDWTGLVDKNMKEIWEGDICKLNGGGADVIFEIGFEDGCFVARVPWKKEGSPELKYYTGFKEEIMSIEVIGNIWENKEL